MNVSLDRYRPSLSAAQKRALKLSLERPLFRTRGGYRASGTALVTMEIAAALVTLGFARIERVRFRDPALMGTDAGRAWLETAGRPKPGVPGFASKSGRPGRRAAG